MPLERRPPPAPTPATVGQIWLGSVRLTLDDVQDVVDYLSRSGLAPVMAAGHALASDAESLKSATRQELARVTIGVKEGSVSVEFRRDLARILYSVNNAEAAAVAEGVASLLRPRRVPAIFVWFIHVMQIYAFMIAVMVVLFLLITVTGVWEGGSPPTISDMGTPTLYWLLLAPLLVGSVMFYARYQPGRAKILPYFRRERREVTVSIRQALWVGVVTAVVSGAAGAVITWAITTASGKP
jgi:hypothetical protein